MNTKNPKVDDYLAQEETWREEAKKLRALALASGLTEEIKWGKPCYSREGRNVLIIQGFKGYCALMFCKGVLLKDPRRLLHRPGEHTQSARQLRFTSAGEIAKLKPTVAAYIREAIEVEKAGLEVAYKTTPEPLPAELREKFSSSPTLKSAFYSLTPGRQRAYLLFFSGAKQSATRTSRIEKCTARILERNGLND
jgi:uncharacterized protein YdeI (YjbR/CyaY-like superfamily)